VQFPTTAEQFLKSWLDGHQFYCSEKQWRKEHYRCIQHMAQTNMTVHIVADTDPQFPVRAEGDQTQCLHAERLKRSRSRCGIRCRHATARQKRQVGADRATGCQLHLLDHYKGPSCAPSEMLSLHAPLPTQFFSKSKGNPLMN